MTDMEEFFTGRIWLRQFCPFPEETVRAALENGSLRLFKGITENRQCVRCLEKSVDKIIAFHCSNCGKDCFYCRHCLQMGRISSCTELVTWAVPTLHPPITHSFVWNGVLTPSQKKASSEVSASVSNNRSHLVYAVCGAGKTELLFPAIFKALQEGKRICIAAPRIDVVLELSPRIRSVFPKTIIHTLYGGSPAETGFASIVIATTHQLFRFHQAFDLLIVDEADAFPYSCDAALQRAAKKSMKETGSVVYVSATPSTQLLREVPNQSRLFSRFHGHPLPVPEYKSLWNYSKTFSRNKIPEKLTIWVREQLRQKKPFLLFFPTIEMIESAIPLFKTLHPSIEAVHAEDPLRKEKVMRLRESKIPGILTSTILERGITIPDIQVAVIGADERIFDASALIQIAGRAGRAVDHPAGDVIFFHNGISKEMDKARLSIVSYNKGERG